MKTHFDAARKLLESSKSGSRIEKLESNGLGDTVAKITKALGIPACGGCKHRQAKLNGLFPYNKGIK